MKMMENFQLQLVELQKQNASLLEDNRRFNNQAEPPRKDPNVEIVKTLEKINRRLEKQDVKMEDVGMKDFKIQRKKELNDFTPFINPLSQDFVEWLDDLEMILTRSDIPRSAWTGNVLVRIRGDAKNTLDNIYPTLHKKDYEEVRNALMVLWYDLAKQTIKEEKLQSIKKAIDESASTFISRLDRSFRLCREEYTEGQKVKILC